MVLKIEDSLVNLKIKSFSLGLDTDWEVVAPLGNVNCPTQSTLFVDGMKGKEKPTRSWLMKIVLVLSIQQEAVSICLCPRESRYTCFNSEGKNCNNKEISLRIVRTTQSLPNNDCKGWPSYLHHDLLYSKAIVHSQTSPHRFCRILAHPDES